MQEINLQKFDPCVAKGLEIKEKADSLVITKPEDLQTARWAFKECQTLEKETEEKRKWLIGPLSDAVKKVNTYVKEILLPVSEAKVTIKDKVFTFNEEQEKIRAEKAEIERKELEEKRLKEEKAQAEKEAEEARLRKIEEDKLEATRKEQAEKQKKIDEEQNENKRKEQEIEQKKIDAEAKLEKERIEIDRKNREIEKEKEQIEKDKAEMERQKVANAKKKKEDDLIKTYKVKGIRNKTTYEIINEGDIPRIYCSPDSKKINAAIKRGIRSIEGLNIFNQKSMQ